MALVVVEELLLLEQMEHHQLAVQVVQVQQQVLMDHQQLSLEVVVDLYIVDQIILELEELVEVVRQ